MTEPQFLHFILDDDFQNYEQWNGSAMTFTHGGQDYTLGLNAFTDFDAALAAKGEADATLLLASGDIPFGDYDNAAPATWNGLLAFTAANGDALELPPLCVKGQLALTEHSSIACGLISQQGTLHITNGSTMMLTYHLGPSFNHLEGLAIDGGGCLTDTGKLGAGFTLHGTNTVEGTQSAPRTYEGRPAISVQKGVVLAENAALALSDGAVADFQTAELAAASRVTLRNAWLNVSGNLSMSSGSTLFMDADSFLSVAGETMNGGGITVDASGFRGYRKVVDISGRTDSTKDIEVINAADNLTALHLPDGDLILTTADMSTYLIDTSWKETRAMGDMIDDSGDFIFAVNAFASYDTAYANARIMTPKQKIKLINGQTTMTGGNLLTDLYIQNGSTLITASGDFIFGGDANEDAPRLVIEADSALDGQATSFTLRSQARLNLEGQSGHAAILDFSDSGAGGGVLVLQDAAVLDADFADIRLGSLAFQSPQTEATFSDSSIRLSGFLLNGVNAESLSDGRPQLEFNRSTLEISGTSESDNYGALIFSDGSAITLSHPAHARFGNYGVITLDNASMNTAGNVANCGTLSLDNALIDLGGTLTNSRNLTAQNESTVRLESLDNSGTVTLETTQATVNGQLKNIGELTLDDASLYVGGLFSNGHSANFLDSEVTVHGKMTNDAETTFDASCLEVDRTLTNNGSLTLANGSVLKAENLTSTGACNIQNAEANISKTMVNTRKLTLTDASLAVGDNIENSGTIQLYNASLTASGVLTNTGTLAFGLDSALEFSAFSGINGTVTVDMTGAEQEIYKIIDITGEKEHGIESFGDITLSDDRYRIIAYDNDLYACNLSTVRVDTSWTAETVLPEGFYWGLNAFNDLNTAVKSTSGGTLTYLYTYNNPDYDDALAIFNATPVSGSVNITYKDEDDTLASYALSDTKMEKFDIERGRTYTIAFDGDPSQYKLRLSLLNGHQNQRESLEYEEISYGYIAPDTGPKEYALTVEDGTSGVFTFAVGGMDRYLKYAVINADTKQTIFSGSEYKNYSFSTCLTQGNYLVTVSCYDKTNSYYSTDFKVTANATIFTDVQTTDDAVIMDDTEGKLKTLSAAQDVLGFVGLGDEMDWIKLDLASGSGKYDIFLNTEENEDAGGLRLELVYAKSKTTTETIERATYYGNSTEPILKNITFNASKDYFLKIKTPNKATASNNGTYTISMDIASLLPDLCNDDDTFNAQAVQDAPYNGMPLENWLGEEDKVDWLKISDGAFEGSRELDVSANGGTLKTALYRIAAGQTAGALQQVENWYTYSGRTSTTDVNFAAGYDYYLQFSMSSSFGELTYGMAIA